MTDWARLASELDARGHAIIESVWSAHECKALAALYPRDEGFRSRVVMERHGFGRGEYKYFGYPLPDPISSLRTATIGAADIPVALIRRILDELPYRVLISGYGLTEGGTAAEFEARKAIRQ